MKDHEKDFDYYDKKYFTDRSKFSKNLDEDPFELTFKLYKTHEKKVKKPKDEDYVEYFP